MKHLTLVLTALLAASVNEVFGQNLRIGLDVGDIVRIEAVRIDAEYGFSQKWSAGGEACIDIRALKRKIKPDEYEHRKNLDDSTVSNETEYRYGLQNAGIFFQYWPAAKFYGPSICIGGRISNGYKADMLIGVGYSCRILKGLSVGISLRTSLLGPLKAQGMQQDALQIKIYHDF